MESALVPTLRTFAVLDPPGSGELRSVEHLQLPGGVYAANRQCSVPCPGGTLSGENRSAVAAVTVANKQASGADRTAILHQKRPVAPLADKKVVAHNHRPALTDSQRARLRVGSHPLSNYTTGGHVDRAVDNREARSTESRATADCKRLRAVVRRRGRIRYIQRLAVEIKGHISVVDVQPQIADCAITLKCHLEGVADLKTGNIGHPGGFAALPVGTVALLPPSAFSQ